ncbi:oxygen-independent coproporphyrinogen III oxidase [Pseudoroseomonas cervicalis]|uniref:oxygen-independent coproporphyrinogen III oxidase n=1 Tax=Teichococcus cervicalis TaxID=204525 RepID=UPI0027886129|nr:oxygen-independent coproporphyrinogen III oxidase [Pseudoroseomonas cervicalis]MDQ1081393.1 oxygen-independent coproporphyrinogen-3 oxidase [Pseudoroseomonas cervicalis]
MSPETFARYAGAALPRYTSYPTAPHFAPLAEAEYRAWLSGIAPGDALSLYVHIPFCRSLCWYCGCHTAVTRMPARLARYSDGLLAEAALLAAALPAHGGVSALHLGGGTPSSIGAEGLSRLLAALRRHFPFRDTAELAIELDPRVLTPVIADALAEGGITRASLGVQDIDPEVQARIGRIQPSEQVARAVALLRERGIGAINLDLMYGLPGQGVAEAEASARFAAELGADRVAVFGYAHVPWMKPAQNAIDARMLPGAEDRLAQAEAAASVLEAAGYQRIGLDHFARPTDPMARAALAGALRRNFQGYTTDAAPVLLGLGASSIGRLPAGFAQNIADERGWLAEIEAGRLAIARGRALTEEDRQRASLIERLMCDLALPLRAVPETVLEAARPRLAPLLADGVVAEREGRLEVTERRFLRHAAAAFDAYLGQGPGRHSKAV